MDKEKKRLLVQEWSRLITPQRFARMQQVVDNRTRYVTAVLEDIYRSPNSNAAIRSLECFGIQDVHMVEGRFKAKLNDAIAKGATRWTTIKQYQDDTASSDGASFCAGIERCFSNLRREGYMIVATTPHSQGYSLPDLPVDKKLALVFGNEEAGISSYAREHADAYVTIPMYGFTESFNIAASVAIVAYDLVTRVKRSGINWRLSPDEKIDILYEWLYATGRMPESNDQL